MSRAALGATRATVYRWFRLQLIIITAAVLLFWFFQGIDFAKAVILGALVCMLPNVLFARWWFLRFKASDPSRLLKYFYLGEIGKLCLIGILFLLVLKFLTLNVLGCLVGFIIAQLAFWVAPLVLKH